MAHHGVRSTATHAQSHQFTDPGRFRYQESCPLRRGPSPGYYLAAPPPEPGHLASRCEAGLVRVETVRFMSLLCSSVQYASPFVRFLLVVPY